MNSIDFSCVQFNYKDIKHISLKQFLANLCEPQICLSTAAPSFVTKTMLVVFIIISGDKNSLNHHSLCAVCQRSKNRNYLGISLIQQLVVKFLYPLKLVKRTQMGFFIFLLVGL